MMRFLLAPHILAFPNSGDVFRTVLVSAGAIKLILETPTAFRRSVERLAALSGEEPRSILARYARAINRDAYEAKDPRISIDFGLGLDDVEAVARITRPAQSCRGISGERFDG